MSNTNIIALGKKTIDQLELYNSQDHGELITDDAANNAKFAVYIKDTDSQTINDTKSINLSTLRNLIDTNSQGEQQEIPQIEERDFNTLSPNYQTSMLISPKVFDNHTTSLIIQSQAQARYDEDIQDYLSGLMPANDKKKIDEFNLVNGILHQGSLRTKSSKEQGNTYYLGINAFSEGNQTQASGENAHSEGSLTKANGFCSHAGGEGTIAQGDHSFAIGSGTVANGNEQVVIGKYNVLDNNNAYSFIIGTGIANNRDNALTIDWSGRIKIKGNQEITDNKHLTTKQYVDNAIQTHSQLTINNIINTGQIGNKKIVDYTYPIGSIYLSVTSTNPSSLFEGTTWVQITDTFLLASGTTYPADNGTHTTATAGQATVKLTAAQSGLVAHTHGFTQPEIASTGNISTGEMEGNNSTLQAKFNSRATDYNRGQIISSGSANVKTVSQTSTWDTVNQVNGAQKGYTHTISFDVAHTHTVPSHSHTLSKQGAVQTELARQATQAHNNMPPYLPIYVWKRTA